jgi:hypothetical protein
MLLSLVFTDCSSSYRTHPRLRFLYCAKLPAELVAKLMDTLEEDITFFGSDDICCIACILAMCFPDWKSMVEGKQGEKGGII